MTVQSKERQRDGNVCLSIFKPDTPNKIDVEYTEMHVVLKKISSPATSLR